MLNMKNITKARPNKITNIMFEANTFAATINEIKNGWKNTILWSKSKNHSVVYSLTVYSLTVYSSA